MSKETDKLKQIIEDQNIKRKKVDNIVTEDVRQDPLIKSVIVSDSADNSTALKTITVDATAYADLNIIIFGDVHIGNKDTNHEQYLRDLELAAKVDNAIIIFLGDWLSNGTLGSANSPHLDSINPLEQQKFAIKSIKSNPRVHKRIVAILDGNHEGGARAKDSMLSPLNTASTALGMYDRHVDNMVKIIVNVTNPVTKKIQPLVIGARHGAGGGGGHGASLDAAKRIMDVIGHCDIVLMGHTHQNESGETRITFKEKETGKISEHNVLMKVCNSYQGYGDYPGEHAMTPGDATNNIINVQIAKNMDVLDAGKRMNKSISPYKYNFAEIPMGSPQFNDFLTKQTKINLIHSVKSTKNLKALKKQILKTMLEANKNNVELKENIVESDIELT